MWLAAGCGYKEDPLRLYPYRYGHCGPQGARRPRFERTGGHGNGADRAIKPQVSITGRRWGRHARGGEVAPLATLPPPPRKQAKEGRW
jgi:hypothetical protein